MMKFMLLFLPLFLISTAPDMQKITGKKLLERSIKYHDPDGKWDTFQGAFPLIERRPDGTQRVTKIFLDNAVGVFKMNQNRDGQHIVMTVTGDEIDFTLNGSSEISDSDKEKFKLKPERAKLLRNYYTYLWGLPMKLKDPGTLIHDDVEVVDFQGEKLYSLKVTYNEEVGKDTWYFYFDRSDFSLKGYRFYHVESDNDGEYITLEGEESLNGLKIPKARKWFVNKDDKFLGEDILSIH